MDYEDGIIFKFPRELIDHTIGYLHNSPETMRACALVCKMWLPIARFHIFHTINLNQRSMGQADRVARRFCELFDRELDVTQLIREISISWSAVFVYSLLKKVDFTRLTRLGKVSLKFISWSQLSLELIKTVQILFALPSLTHLVVYCHIFEDIKQFATLFDECRLDLKTLTLADTAIIKAEDIKACMDTFDSDRPRAQLRSLTLQRSTVGHIIPWLLHKHSPIDLGTLRSLSYEDEDIPMLQELLSVVSSSLKFLEIMSPSKLIGTEDIDISPAFLPHLTRITIRNIRLNSLSSTTVLLSQLKSSSRVEQITLVIDTEEKGDAEAQWDRLDEQLYGLELQALTRVQVIAKRNFETVQERRLAVQMMEVRFRRMIGQRIFSLF